MEFGRGPASSCSFAASKLDDRPNFSSLQVCDQLRTSQRNGIWLQWSNDKTSTFKCNEVRNLGIFYYLYLVTLTANQLRHKKLTLIDWRHDRIYIYIKENRTPLSSWRPLIGSSRDFTREHGSSRAWKWSRYNVDCGFLIKVTRENSVTLTSQQQRRRPAGSDQPASSSSSSIGLLQYSKPLLW